MRSRARAAVRMLLLLSVFVGAFPDVTIRGSTGFDGSWVAEINRLAHRGEFGAKWGYTYGPLGWVLHPIDIGRHLAVAGALRFTATALLVVLVEAWSRQAGSIRLALLCAANVLAVATGLFFEYQLVLIAVLLGCFAATSTSRWPAVALGALSAAAVFVKLTLGITFAAIAGSAVLVRLAREPRRSAALVISTTVAFVVTLVLLSQLTFGGMEGLLGWLRIASQIAAGFSEAMSFQMPGVTAPSVHCGAAILATCVWVAVAAASVRRRHPAGIVFVLSAVPMFLAFKHAFVLRSPWHTEMFFPLALSLLGIAAVRVDGRTLVRVVVRSSPDLCVNLTHGEAPRLIHAAFALGSSSLFSRDMSR